MAREGIIFTPKAEADLRQIFDHISAFSLEAALLQVDRILDKADLLLKFPKLGRVIPELDNERCRELVVGTYLIAYFIVSPDQIHILSVHHSGKPR